MPTSACTAAPTLRKRAVNLSLNEGLVAQAKAYTNNLSATMEVLLADYVTQQQHTRHARQQMADTCVSDWNAVHAKLGSFADAHSTL